MAAGDYRSCDRCVCKTFYDANLNYEQAAKDQKAARYNGTDQPYGNMLDHLGDWAVICDDCAKTHRCIVVTEAEYQNLEARRNENESANN